MPAPDRNRKPSRTVRATRGAGPEAGAGRSTVSSEEKGGAGGRPGTFPTWVIAFGLIALSFLVYARSLLGGFVWDDVAITDSRVVRRAGGIFDIWFNPRANPAEEHYWPIVYTTFWAEHSIWKLWAPGYRAVNVLLHGINAVVLWALLRWLAVPGALFAAALFVVHPVHVESVAWIIERKDVLSALFYLIALWSMLLYLRRAEDRESNPSRTALQPDAPSATRYLILGCVFFVFGMLSKSIVVTLPAALLLVQWWRNGRLQKRDWMAAAPLFALGFFISLADLAYGRTYFAHPKPIAFAERLMIAPRAFWFYLEKLAWPHPLMAQYPKWPAGQFGAGGLAWAALGVLVVVLWFARRRITRGPLAAILFFGGTLVPVLGIIPFGFMQYAYVADRFQYLASVGPIVLFAATASWAARRFAGSQESKILIGAAALVVCALGLRTFFYAPNYSDAERLWRHTLAHNENAFEARQQLGKILTERWVKRMQDAADRVVAQPGNRAASAEYDAIMADRREFDEGVRLLRRALELNADFPAALYNLGVALMEREQYAEAESLLRRADKLTPNTPSVQNALGSVLARSGRIPEAMEFFLATLELEPDNIEAATNLQNARADLAARQGKR